MRPNLILPWDRDRSFYAKQDVAPSHEFMLARVTEAARLFMNLPHHGRADAYSRTIVIDPYSGDIETITPSSSWTSHILRFGTGTMAVRRTYSDSSHSDFPQREHLTVYGFGFGDYQERAEFVAAAVLETGRYFNCLAENTRNERVFLPVEKDCHKCQHYLSCVLADHAVNVPAAPKRKARFRP